MKGHVVLLTCLLIAPLASLSLAAQSGDSSPGLNFVKGPPDGLTVAIDTAKRLARGVVPDSVTARPPVALYLFDSDAIASGKGMESSQPRGFKYLLESSGSFVGAAEIRLTESGAARFSGLSTGRFDSAAMAAIDVLAGMDRIKAGTYEVRLIDQGSLQLVAIWLKSMKDEKDLIYPLSEAFSRYQTGRLYTADEFLLPFRQPYADVQWTTDAGMHGYFLGRFLESPGNGTARVLAPPMMLNDFMRLTVDSRKWQLDSMELIGIARHANPVAFVIRRHGIEMQGGGTRELTTAERQALDKLRAGAEVAVQSSSAGRVVVGALRADASCIRCHDDQNLKVGDLLGALSYRLSPAKGD